MTEPAKNVQILRAVASATAQVDRVKKDGDNKQGDYKYASIDAFLEMTGKICAANGLIVHMDEMGITDTTRKGKFGDNAHLLVRYEITLYHTSGEYMPSVTRSVEVIRSGAQSYGSAQSYVLKQYLRGLLQIPTGDKDDADADSAPVSKPSSSAHMKRALVDLDAALSTTGAAAIDALAKQWARKMNEENWPAPEIADDENSFRHIVKEKFKARREAISATTPTAKQPALADAPPEILQRAKIWLGNCVNLEDLEMAWAEFEHNLETFNDADAKELKRIYAASLERLEPNQIAAG